MDYHLNIPKKYVSRHHYLIFCNDVLASLLQYVDSKKLTSHRFTFDSKEQAEEFELCQKNDPNAWQDWMIQNGHKVEIYEVFYRHTLFSLLRDFCNYTFESFRCAASMKIWVAYSLLRKPFRDNLGYIEWLIADKEGIISNLYDGKPEDIELKKDKARKNIDAIMKLYPALMAFDGIYTTRYDNNSDISFEKIWHKANHLITTRPYTRSNDGSLNFIYTNREETLSFVDYYYLTVPYVMAYVIELICTVFEAISDMNTFTKSYNQAIRTLKFYRVVGRKSISNCVKAMPINLLCPKCGKTLFLSENTMQSIMDNNLKCCFCKFEFETYKYMFDWQKRVFTLASKRYSKKSSTDKQ